MSMRRAIKPLTSLAAAGASRQTEPQRPIRIERKVINGQEVDVRIYAPIPAIRSDEMASPDLSASSCFVSNGMRETRRDR